MSEGSMTPGRGEHVDNQSLLSASVQGVSTTVQNPNRSTSNAERTSVRNERQRIQRSSSATSEDSHGSAQRATRTTARVEGATGGSHVNSVASLGSGVSGERRAGRHRRQVIRLPDQPGGQVRQVRRRLPTPEPDTIERVYIQRTAAEVVEEITEIPTTPPPRVQERTVIEPAGPPQVIKRVIRVPPRGNNYGTYQQIGTQYQQTGTQYQQSGAQYQQTGAQYQQTGAQYQTTTSTSAPVSFGNIQQAATSLQQDVSSSSYQPYGATPGVTSLPSNYANTYSTADSNYGTIAATTAAVTAASTGNVYPTVQQGFSFPQATGAFPSQQVAPPIGCHPAFCFYV